MNIYYLIAGVVAIGAFFLVRNISIDFETGVVVLLAFILIALWDLKKS